MVGAAGDCPSVNVFLALSLSNMCTVATEDNRSEEVIQAVLLVSVTEWKREKERKKCVNESFHYLNTRFI